jgi:hypothetical protein
MPSQPPPVSDEREGLRRQLRQKAAPGEGVAAQVFFDGSVPPDRLAETANAAMQQAAARTGRKPSLRIGKVHPLANSVSVRGDPDLIADLMEHNQVTSVLPSEIDDIYPKPVARRPVK